ncbi:hypothetical protein GBP346_B2906 [Burkholderia pseudomallei MSHR346]|nr:hypothetical protein GBP346_B2906 [Burkholderia pseudomallei MSHR346]
MSPVLDMDRDDGCCAACGRGGAAYRGRAPPRAGANARGAARCRRRADWACGVADAAAAGFVSLRMRAPRKRARAGRYASRPWFFMRGNRFIGNAMRCGGNHNCGIQSFLTYALQPSPSVFHSQLTILIK